MAREFRLPDLGEGVHEGQIVRLLVAEGEPVREDQPLMEVETDKAAVEIPSPLSGVIEKWHVREGQVVNVGDVMVSVGEAEGAAKGDPVLITKGVEGGAAKPHATADHRQAAAVAERVASSRTPASPAVRKLAREKGVDLENMAGSGPGGRVTREDVEHAAKAGKHQSVQRQAKSDGHAKPQAAHAAGRAAISQARKTIARVMSESWATIPHVTDTDDADVTDLERLRKQYASGQEAGDPKLTMLPFIIRAVSRALQKFPAFNASFDAGRSEIVYHEDINIAVGVHTERGLIAPVIRNADRLGIVEIARALAEIADKARKATFAVNDTRGGTYTISNPGAMGGSRYSSPIITPPQVAVLAAGRMKWMPWVVGQTSAAPGDSPGAKWGEGANIVPRLILPLSHSFDHRIIDGGEEVQFMRHVIDDLENPGRLVL